MNTNHTNPPYEPDEQALLDFGDRVASGTAHQPENDLETTMARVHNALRADTDDTTAMPAEFKTQIWENIMTSIPIPEAAASANPWTQPEAPANRNQQRLHRRPARPAPLQRMAWSGAANIALTLVLILAAFGAFRAFEGDLPFGGGGNNTPGGGQYAYAPLSTPEESESAAIIASPETTKEAPYACDFSEGIPVFSNVPQSPIDGTSLYFQGKTLWLHCSEEAEDIELAQGVVNVGAGPIAGVVTYGIMPEGITDLVGQERGYLNLTSGEMIQFSTPEESMQLSLATATGSPWVVGASATDPSGMQVVDLRTMASTGLSTLIGNDATLPNQMTASGASESGTLAVAFKGADLVEVDETTGAGTVTPGKTAREAGLPGDILIIDDSIDSAHWITLPDDLQDLREMWISPDGSAVAIAGFEGRSDAPIAPYTYATLNTADGSVMGRSQPIEFRDNPFALWIQDGSTIAYTAGNSVQTLGAEPGAQPKTILEGDQQFFSVRSTTDPDVIVATVREDHGSDADPASTDMDKVYSVNLVTGDTHEFGGMELGNMIGWNTSANALLIYDYIGMGDGEVTIRVFDPVSGDLLDTIGNVPNPNNTGRLLVGKNSITTSDDGSTSVYSIGTQDIFVVKATDNGPSFRKLDPPSSLGGTATVVLSPNGNMLSMVNNNDEARTRWMIDLTDPDAEWLQVPYEGVGSGSGFIGFIEGTGN